MKQAIVAKAAWRTPGRRGEGPRVSDALITLKAGTLEIIIEPIQLSDHELVLTESVMLQILGSLFARVSPSDQNEKR